MYIFVICPMTFVLINFFIYSCKLCITYTFVLCAYFLFSGETHRELNSDNVQKHDTTIAIDITVLTLYINI